MRPPRKGGGLEGKPASGDDAKAPGEPPLPGAKVGRGAIASDDDRRLFEQAMKDVRPLAPDGRRRAPLPPVPSPRRTSPRGDVVASRPDSGAGFSLEELGEQVSGLAAGADRRLLRRLRGEEFPVEATLDLHGRSQDEATRALDRFIDAAFAAGRRCVLVIHGRGQHSGAAGPVLNHATRQRLIGPRLRGGVLAFVSAPPALGGVGALLILLRKPSR